jgi:ProP effector
LHAWLGATWPKAFGGLEMRPLALGAGATILELRPPWASKKDMAAAMAAWVRSTAYLESIARDGSRRVGLDGGDAGEITDEHRAHARAELEQRMAARRNPKENRHG